MCQFYRLTITDLKSVYSCLMQLLNPGTIILALLLLGSCTPKLSSKIDNPQTPLGPQDALVILNEADPFENDGIKVGSIKAGDSGLSTQCSYYEVLEILITKARAEGANLLKITQWRRPDNWSTCDRITADIYHVPNPRHHEIRINWSADRLLTWADFKGEPKPKNISDFAAETRCGFEIDANHLVFSKNKVYVYSTFDCVSSWVRGETKNQQGLLEHEQYHFNLSEVHARRLRKLILQADYNRGNMETVLQALFKQEFAAFNKRSKQYDEETNHGLQPERQFEWQETIDQELFELQGYQEAKVY